MNNDYRRLLDVQESIAHIEKYAARGKEEFENSELIQVWVIHHLQIIGEALGRLSGDLKSKYPGMPWRKIKGMRNILVHDYFGIDLEIVWRVIEADLLDVKGNINLMIKEEEPLR